MDSISAEDGARDPENYQGCHGKSALKPTEPRSTQRECLAHNATSNPVCSGLTLIITADDFGIGRATSAGIIRAHRDGPVTAASLMTVTGDHAKASVALLGGAPDLEVGLHLVLAGPRGRPLVARTGSGLVDANGRFLSNAKLWLRAWSGQLDRNAVVEEIAAQAEMFRALLGRPPSYVDSHYHAHQLPAIRAALLEVVRSGILPPVTRTTVEPSGIRAGVKSARIRRWAAHWLGSQARAEFRRQHLWTNDFFFGMLDSTDLCYPFPWSRYLGRFPRSGTVEWVVHPGLLDDTLVGEDHYITERVRELEVLTSTAAFEALARAGAKLATKAALRRSAATL